MTDQTLKAIDEGVVIAAEFLEDFGNEKRACLKAYAESQGIVNWIKEVTDGDYNTHSLFHDQPFTRSFSYTLHLLRCE